MSEWALVMLKGRVCMEEKKTYKIVPSGKKAERRNYSKVSGSLDLPNLVEIQTDSFEWFVNKGIREVFEEIYPKLFKFTF